MRQKQFYGYDYCNGIATQRERAFKQVMQNQLKYDFLKHDEILKSSAGEKQKIINNINKRIARLTKKLETITLTILMFFVIGLSGCEKQYNQAEHIKKERELIIQELKLKNINSMPMTKGFDPNTWIYEYNTTPSILTLTNVNNPAETVTRTVTIQQLIEGITVSIFEGVYDITFLTTHTNTVSLDIKIDMQDVNINGTPISLQATYQDFLIVIDVPNIEYAKIIDGARNEIERFNILADMLYIYYDKNRLPNNGELSVSYYRTGDGQEQVFCNINSFQLGNVYWLTSKIGTGIKITFPNWTVNKIEIS